MDSVWVLLLARPRKCAIGQVWHFSRFSKIQSQIVKETRVCTFCSKGIRNIYTGAVYGQTYFFSILHNRIPWKFWGEKFHGKLYTQTFTKKLPWNPTYFLLNPYLNGAILNFHMKKFRGHVKKCKNRKTFLPRNSHGIR